MAMMDRLRERMRGQHPVGAAAQPVQQAQEQQGIRPGAAAPQTAQQAVPGQQMPMGTQIPDIGRGRMAQAEEPDLDRLTARKTTEAYAAGAMGERMGAESIMEMAGITPKRRGEIAEGGRIMNPQRLNQATQILLKYQAAKSSVNKRIINAQQWWKLNNWQEIRKDRGVRASTTHPSNTGWLWNCIVGKHADCIDSYPEPVILPRMIDDKEEAEKLSKIVPVVMEMNDFEETYNDCSWQKMQEGTGGYGVFWNPRKLFGLGDIDIKKVNLLFLYWEPGISDIQESRNVFYVSFEDKKDLERAYPQLEGKLNTTKITIEEYKTDDTVDNSNKAVVVDWYYKQHDPNGRAILHYCKYVNDTCLYSSEEAGLANGYYEDGEYPFVLDALFPVEGSPAGYGYIDIAKDTQTDIDTLSQAMVQNAVVRSTPRYFIRKDGAVNEKEFADISNPLVHVNGNLGQDSLLPISVNQMGNDVHNMYKNKIDEIKFVCGNTDVNNGGVPSGVTAASAIAALKEDSGRSSKDSTKAAYRAYRKIVIMVIERIRQFYDIPRQFRILGAQGQEEFVQYDNSHLQPQIIPNMPGDEPGMRIPMYDVEVRAQRENAYTKMSQNELALQFYDKGFFAPGNGDQALLCLEMMDFRNKEEVKKRIEQQGTMMQTLMKVGQIALMLAQKFQPEVAPKLTEALQGIQNQAGKAPQPMGGGQQKPGRSDSVTAPADNTSAPNPNENQLVRRARERSEEATRPS